MAGLAKKTVTKKVKKHGVKAGQKSKVRPSQKKSVKNGRHQEKQIPKKNVKKAVAAIPDGLDGKVLDDEFDEYLQEPEFDNALEPEEEEEFFGDVDESLHDNLESEED